VVDGEIVVPSATTTGLDFEALLQRVHPAESRVRLLAEQTPALFVAFDLLAFDDDNWMPRPFAERRAAMEAALSESGVNLTPVTTNRDQAVEWFHLFEGAGLDGLIVKRPDLTYQPDKRVMAKVKHDRTAECVVAGYRVHTSGPDAVGSLLLGLYDEDAVLVSVGVVGAFSMARRRELMSELQPLVTAPGTHPWSWAAQEAGTRTPRDAEGSRWNRGKDLSFVPLRPELVVEVAYDHMEGTRFRHTTQFRRWRPDRDPRSCTYSQLEEPVRFDLADVLTASEKLT